MDVVTSGSIPNRIIRQVHLQEITFQRVGALVLKRYRDFCTYSCSRLPFLDEQVWLFLREYIGPHGRFIGCKAAVRLRVQGDLE